VTASSASSERYLGLGDVYAVSPPDAQPYVGFPFGEHEREAKVDPAARGDDGDWAGLELGGTGTGTKLA